jgi:hypothetical protein
LAGQFALASFSPGEELEDLDSRRIGERLEQIRCFIDMLHEVSDVST